MYIKAIRSIRKKNQKLTLQSTYERTYKTQNLLLFKVLRITLNSIKSTESLQLTLMSLLQMLLHSTTPPPSKKGGGIVYFLRRRESTYFMSLLLSFYL